MLVNNGSNQEVADSHPVHRPTGVRAQENWVGTPIFGKHYPVQQHIYRQMWWWEEPSRRALMTMFGGVREMDWFLCKNPGQTGRVTWELFGLVRINALDRSSSSETLLSEAKSVKKPNFHKKVFKPLSHRTAKTACVKNDPTALATKSITWDKFDAWFCQNGSAVLRKWPWVFVNCACIDCS